MAHIYEKCGIYLAMSKGAKIAFSNLNIKK